MFLNPNERQNMTEEKDFPRISQTAFDIFHQLIAPKLLEVKEEEDIFFVVNMMFSLGCETIALAMAMQNEMVPSIKAQHSLLQAIMKNIEKRIEGIEKWGRENGPSQFIN